VRRAPRSERRLIVYRLRKPYTKLIVNLLYTRVHCFNALAKSLCLLRDQSNFSIWPPDVCAASSKLNPVNVL